MYEKCCGSIVQGWQWGRSSYQAYQTSQLEMEQGKPYWEKPASPAEKSVQLEKLQAQEQSSNQAKQQWEVSQDKKVATVALQLCALKAQSDAQHLSAFQAASEARYTVEDADEPLSDYTLNDIPLGTADGADDLSVETQSSLHRSIEHSTATLQEELDVLQTHHQDELMRADAAKVFTEVEAMMTKVLAMNKDGFVDEHTLRVRQEAAGGSGGATAAAEQQEEQMETNAADAGAQQLALRQAEFAQKQKELAVQKEMEASARNAEITEQLAKELFEIKQQPPPVAPAPDAVLPVDYEPHAQKLAYMEAKVHRSYAAFLTGSHRATLQLAKLYKAAKRRTALIQDIKAKLQTEYGRLETLGDSTVSDVSIKALKMAESLYQQLQNVESAENDAIKNEEQQMKEHDDLIAKLHRAKTMVALASGTAPEFNEEEKLAAARNKKVNDMVNKLNEAANGVVTGDAKSSFGRAISRLDP
jgi:hypothetical protein